MVESHPLLGYFLDAAKGVFPPVDGEVTVLGPLAGGLECSVAFTGHAVVATARPADEVRAHGADGFGESMAPDFLRHLAGPGGWIGCLDATLVTPGSGGPAQLGPLDGADAHPRVQHARDIRAGVEVYGDARGLVTLAQGLAGRRELSIELHDPDEPLPGRGRTLIADALTLVPEGEPVFAAVSPGNARSLRAFLACGFTPVGSEVLLRPRRPGRPV
ncbi:hypothetical protein ACIHEI_29985 [Kitasatospora sp. NPDC051984]|uniref:hypothetical protein n=1 Tax=Kitasatospora sp. NPDC051984 TaxID=3364059 RepID=UPI0037C90D33